MIKFCLHILSTVVILGVIQGNLASSSKPNIVILLADDMGWNDVGYHGSEIATPNIDALAYSGIRLNRYYTLPACTPSRSALLTGKYAVRIGMQGKPLAAGENDGIPLNETLLPQYLKNLGYATHLVGKWHVGASSWDSCPNKRGFDTFFGYHNGFVGYYDGCHKDQESGMDFWRNQEKAWDEVHGKYLPEVIAQEAVRVIENHHKHSPLLLVVSPVTPHTGNLQFGLEPPPERYSTLTDPHRRLYADMMRYLDDTLGNVTQALKKSQMINNTIILFMSDNGSPTIDNVWGYSNYGSNYPFRGMKMSVYEGAIRVPSVLWWNGFKNKGSQVQQMFHVSDWLPTFNTAAGGNQIEGIDGKDQWGFLNDEAPPPREDALVEINDVGGAEAYISGDFKLLKEYNPSYPHYFSGSFYSTDPSKEQYVYNAQEVLNSKVAVALESQMDTETITEERERTRISMSRCSRESQTKALGRNCYDNYCLFNLKDDPSECDDVYQFNVDLAKKLEAKLLEIKDNMIAKRQQERIGHPVDFYWSPWLASGVSSVFVRSGYLTTLVVVVLCCLVIK